MTPAALLAAAYAPNHPSLRWTPANDPEPPEQHRRSTDRTGTVCGIVADLTLAETTDARCSRGCW